MAEALEGIDLTDLDRFAGGFPHDVFTRLRRAIAHLLGVPQDDRHSGIEPTGPLEWARSNKHTGVRHAPVELRPRLRAA